LHKARWQVKRLAITRGLSPCLSLLLRKVRWQVKRLAITRWLSPRLSRLNKELWRVKRFSLVSRVIFFVNAIQTFASISCLRSTEVLIWWMNLMQFFAVWHWCTSQSYYWISARDVPMRVLCNPDLWTLNWSCPYLDCQTRNNNHAWHVLYVWFQQFSTECHRVYYNFVVHIGFHCTDYGVYSHLNL
jgi:hypothetical protein